MLLFLGNLTWTVLFWVLESQILNSAVLIEFKPIYYKNIWIYNKRTLLKRSQEIAITKKQIICGSGCFGGGGTTCIKQFSNNWKRREIAVTSTDRKMHLNADVSTGGNSLLVVRARRLITFLSRWFWWAHATKWGVTVAVVLSSLQVTLSLFQKRWESTVEVCTEHYSVRSALMKTRGQWASCWFECK